MISLLLAAVFLSPAASAAPAKNSAPLWRQTYLYTLDGQAQGYFTETAERRTGEKQLAIIQRWVEIDGSETYIGAVAKDDEALTPAAFFSERKGVAGAYKVDGRVKGRQLTLSFKGARGGKLRRRTALQPGTILSNFVPLFVSRRKVENDPRPLTAVVEDARDGNFALRQGAYLAQAVKRDIGSLNCRKIGVEFDGVAGVWWVAPSGQLCEFAAASGNAKLTMVSEAAAKRALGR